MHILVLVGLLGTATESSDPAAVLSKAVAQVTNCEYQTEIRNLDDNHEELSTKAKKREDVDPVHSLSLPILFKEGRYRLEDGGHALYVGREVLILNFFPVPEDQQLKPAEKEDARFNRAMNFLTGSVFIDRETLGIVRVETRISQEVPYEKWFLTVFRIHELKATIEQYFDETRWRPRRLQMEWRGRSKAGIVKLHERYDIQFSCTP